MARQSLNVNTDAVIALTAKLERLHKSAFPSAVRSTLNDSAFLMKQKNILESAKNNMTVRNQSFFKRYTGVKRATGFKVNSMYSESGFSNSNDIKAKKALEGMEHNEVGGSDNTGAMYLPKARTSNSAMRLVRRKSRFDKSKLAKGTSSYMRSKKLANIQNMVASFQEKDPTYIETSKGKFLVQVKSYKKNANGKIDIKLDFLMRSRRQHVAKAKATHFVKEASLKTAKQIESFYVKNATYQIKKFWK